MTWWLWLILYFVIGLIVYITSCVLNELDCKKEKREMSIESYFNFSWTFFFWPIAAIVGLFVGIFFGIICVSKAITTAIVAALENPPSKDEPNPNEVK